MKIAICNKTYIRSFRMFELCFQRPQFGLALSWLALWEAAIYSEHIVKLASQEMGLAPNSATDSGQAF
jgi:hypothetical protein